jgi:colicin import membrane protein
MTRDRSVEGQRLARRPARDGRSAGPIQAQAEVRRREAARQAVRLDGTRRQGQDLSALFDKELQRQQRTNYETRSQADTRADRQEGESALDGIRDLARRQEELNRRQRELASAAQTADELKRQLEKLSREQEALRQEAEELARGMGEQGSQSQRGGTSPRNQSGSSAVREATDEMRRAAGELQRQSPRPPPNVARRRRAASTA